MNTPLRTPILAVLAATVALGCPAVATAESKEWDIGAYDQCVGSFDGKPASNAEDHKRWVDHMKMCCEKTGGVFKYAGSGGCEAPPAEPAKVTRTPGRIPVGVFTQDLTAMP